MTKYMVILQVICMFVRIVSKSLRLEFLMFDYIKDDLYKEPFIILVD